MLDRDLFIWVADVDLVKRFRKTIESQDSAENGSQLGKTKSTTGGTLPPTLSLPASARRAPQRWVPLLSPVHRIRRISAILFSCKRWRTNTRRTYHGVSTLCSCPCRMESHHSRIQHQISISENENQMKIIRGIQYFRVMVRLCSGPGGLDLPLSVS